MTKLKFWHNTETQIVTKLKNSNCDQTKKTQIVTWRKNSNCDKTQKLKLLPNSKTQNVTRRKNPNCGKTHKPKLLQNSKTQIVIKLKLCQYQNCKKTQKLKVWQNLICLNFLSQFSVTCFFVTQFLWFFFSKKKIDTMTIEGCVQASFSRYSRCFTNISGPTDRQTDDKTSRATQGS